jgi:kynurenine formamidase
MKLFPLCILAFFLLFGCTTPPKDNFTKLFSGQLKVIDLTHSLSSKSPYWPDAKGNPFKYDTIFAQPSGAPGMGIFTSPEHFGTHLDAPIHSADHQPSVDQLNAKELFGPAVVINVETKCNLYADYLLSIEDILNWEKVYGHLPERAIVIMFTGWSRKWDDYRAFKNEDESGKMHFPGFSSEAANFLISKRSILGIGIDDFSVDAGAGKGFPVHGIVNGAGKFHLENVAAVHYLPPNGAYLIIAPIKIEGGSGGPVRIFAIIP